MRSVHHCIAKYRQLSNKRTAGYIVESLRHMSVLGYLGNFGGEGLFLLVSTFSGYAPRQNETKKHLKTARCWKTRISTSWPQRRALK